MPCLLLRVRVPPRGQAARGSFAANFFLGEELCRRGPAALAPSVLWVDRPVPSSRLSAACRPVLVFCQDRVSLGPEGLHALLGGLWERPGVVWGAPTPPPQLETQLGLLVSWAALTALPGSHHRPGLRRDLVWLVAAGGSGGAPQGGLGTVAEQGGAGPGPASGPLDVRSPTLTAAPRALSPADAPRSAAPALRV